MADANLGLHRVLLVDHDHALGRRAAARSALSAGTSPGFQSPKYFSSPAIASSALMSPTTAMQGVVGHEVRLVEVDEVRARQRRQRLGRAAAAACRRDGSRRSGDRSPRRPPSRDPRPTPSAPTAPAAAGARSRPGANVGRCTTSAIRSSASVVAVLHHDGVDEAQVAAGAGAEHAADEVDRRRRSAPRVRLPAPWSSSVAVSIARPVLALRILRRAGPDDHAHADRPAARSG